MTAMKRWTALLVTAAALITVAGCKTTVVNREVPVPVPDHHDDHHDDHRDPPHPDRR